MSNSKKKILLVTTSYPRFQNDIAGCFLELLNNELSQKFDITVLAPDDIAIKQSNKSIIRFTYFFHKKFHRLTYNSGIPENLTNSIFSVIQLPFLFLSLLYSIHKYSFKKHLIITNWLLPCGICGAVISKITGIPHLVIEHSAGIHFLKNLPFKKLLISFLENYSTIIFVSPYLQNIFHTISKKQTSNTFIIPMGIDIEQFNININTKEVKEEINIPIDNKVILFSGRLEEIKGLHILLKALQNIEKVTLIVIGNGKKKSYYQDIARKLQVNAQFLGVITGNKKAQLFKLADIIVVPSIITKNKRTEGAPTVIMEAFAAGKSVIASNSGGIPFIINDNENGKLFKPSDYKELHQILKHIFQDQHFYYKLCEEAKESAQNYHYKKIAQSYTEVINQLI